VEATDGLKRAILYEITSMPTRAIPKLKVAYNVGHLKSCMLGIERMHKVGSLGETQPMVAKFRFTEKYDTLR
jgi:hypothetical protein